MSLEPYPEYKDSRIDRLGHVPRHWKITRLKNSILEAKNGVWGLEPDGSELDLRCVRVADFDRPRLSIHDRNATLRKIPLSEQKGRILEKGDLLLEKSGGGEKSPVGFVVLYDRDEPAVCSNFVSRLVIQPGMDSRFWTYVHSMLYSRRLTQRSIKQTTGIQNLDQASYFDELVAFPTDEEQRVIADFLDRETAEIDAFIADQEQLIGLLEERRTATITHAVTKGLNADAPMKDSGIEWAGQIPEHWQINKISRSFQASKGRNGAALTHEYCASIPGPYPVYSGQTENQGVMALINAYEFDAGNSGVLLTTTVGAKAMSVLHIQNKFSLSQNCMIISPATGVVTRYYYYQFQTLFDYEKGRIPQHMQASFRMEDLYQYKYLKPPSEEEQRITDYLDHETAEFDAAVGDAREAIVLSRERRAALISAAVTGQIDVSQSHRPVAEVSQEVRV